MTISSMLRGPLGTQALKILMRGLPATGVSTVANHLNLWNSAILVEVMGFYLFVDLVLQSSTRGPLGKAPRKIGRPRARALGLNTQSLT